MNSFSIIAKLAMLFMKLLVYPFTRLFCKHRRIYCPPLKDPLLQHSAKELAQMIRIEQVTCEQVIRSYIARINEVNPILNAVVENRFVNALMEAKTVDKFIASKQKTEQQMEIDTPLLGVPLSVKESISLKGMSNAAGMVHSHKKIAKEDADIVRLCKEAGAIPIVVSNTPELCLFWETDNNVTGRTNNPYDSRRTCAGSSGGEAALLASGASVIGLGSDICGSLRLPAHFCGVYGHKPTARTVSVVGHVPETDDELWPLYFATGHMTRYAEDLHLLFNVIAKPEMKKFLQLCDPVSIKDVKFYYMEAESNSIFATSVDREILNAMTNFRTYLQNQHGIQAEKVDIKLMEKSLPISVSQLIELSAVDSAIYDEQTKTFKLAKEFFKFIICRSKVKFYVFFYGIIERIPEFFYRGSTKKAKKLNERLLENFRDILGSNGVLLYPTNPKVAHYHNEAYANMSDAGYLSIFNTLGLPVTSCPIGFTSDGLPMGIQVVANPFNDKLTFAVAQEIEKFCGGWQPRFN